MCECRVLGCWCGERCDLKAAWHEHLEKPGEATEDAPFQEAQLDDPDPNFRHSIAAIKRWMRENWQCGIGNWRSPPPLCEDDIGGWSRIVREYEELGEIIL